MKTHHAIILAFTSGAILASPLFASDTTPLEIGGHKITEGQVFYDSTSPNGASEGWKGFGDLSGFAEDEKLLLRIPAGTKNLAWVWSGNSGLSDKEGVMLSLSVQLSKVPESLQSGMGGFFDIAIKPEGDAPAIAFTLTAAYLRGGSWLLNGLQGGLKIPDQLERKPFENKVLSTGAAETSTGPALDTEAHEFRLIVLPGLVAAFWDDQLIFHAEDPQIAPGKITLRANDPGTAFDSIDLRSLRLTSVSAK